MIYRITFLDYWHLGSGTGAGVALDATVARDAEGLPYLPGKTVKGLLREQAEKLDTKKALHIFGDKGANPARAIFSNATLDAGTRTTLTRRPRLIQHLFDKVTSTKIDDNGIAEDNTLREIEVVIPLTLTGEIVCDKEDEAILKKSMMMIKQIGLNRNRGLGRCTMEVIS